MSGVYTAGSSNMPKRRPKLAALPRINLSDVRSRVTAAASEEAIAAAESAASGPLIDLTTGTSSSSTQWASRADAPHVAFGSAQEDAHWC